MLPTERIEEPIVSTNARQNLVQQVEKLLAE